MNLCILISAQGGPKVLPRVFVHRARADIAYLVAQHMPHERFLAALLTCLSEDIPMELLHCHAGSEVAGGRVHFLSDALPFRLEGRTLRTDRDGIPSGPHPLDGLLQSALASGHRMNIVLLSGFLSGKDTLRAVQKVREKGVRVLACARASAPVPQMIEEAARLGLVDQELPPWELLGALDFGGGPEGGAGGRWLVVDDEAEVRAVLADMLATEGIHSEQAVDGLDALRKVQKAHYAAMLLDLKMPELDGIHTLKALQTIDPGLPIVVVTGYADESLLATLEAHHVLGVIAKPFTADELHKYVARVRAQGRTGAVV